MILMAKLVLWEVTGKNLLIPPKRNQKLKLVRELFSNKYPNTRKKLFSTQNTIHWVPSPSKSLVFTATEGSSLKRVVMGWEVLKEHKIMEIDLYAIAVSILD